MAVSALEEGMIGRLPPVEEARAKFARFPCVEVERLIRPEDADAIAQTAIEVMDRARVVRARPGGPGAVGDEPLRYSVLTGEDVNELFPSLVRLYQNSVILRWWVGSVTQKVLYPSENLTSDINVNYLHGPGGFYQAHVDAAPFTGLLFLQDFRPEEGGGLELWHEWGKRVVQPRKGLWREWGKRVVQPRKGLFLLFDGSAIVHRVQRLRVARTRLSVPMVFPVEPVKRDPELDRYLFKGEA